MIATATKPPGTETFPERELKDAIGKWWDEETSKRLRDPFSATGTLYDVLTEVDSFSAVNVLLVIDSILGFEPPESVIKPGGYRDRKEMIDHLLPTLRNLFIKRRIRH
jgi:hypothetical protein